MLPSASEKRMANSEERSSNQRRFRDLFKGTRLAVEVVLKFLSKLLHVRNDRHGRRIAQGTERAAEHVLCQIPHVVDIFGDAMARVEACQRLLDPIGAFAARDAPSAAFVLVELDD